MSLQRHGVGMEQIRVDLSTRVGILLLLTAVLFAGLRFGPSIRSDAEAGTLQDFLADELTDNSSEWEDGSRSQFDTTGPSGNLRIDSLGFDQAIGTGVTLPDLRAGASWAPQSAISGEGQNVAVAGHRNGWGGPFMDLDEVGHGDSMSLEWATGALANYEVSSIEIVDPDQVHHIMPDPKNGGETLTLITCHPPGTVEQRLIITADLVDIDTTTAHDELLAVPISERVSGEISGEVPNLNEEVTNNNSGAAPAPAFGSNAVFLFPLLALASLAVVFFSSRRFVFAASMVHVVASFALVAQFSL